MLHFADWFDDVPEVFSLPAHPKDNHFFNLAITSRADLVVTFENRLLLLDSTANDDGLQLRLLARSLRIIRPDVLSQELSQGAGQ